MSLPRHSSHVLYRWLLNLPSLRDLLSPEGYPVLFATVGIIYGIGVGVLFHNHLALVASDMAFWVAPVLFAFFIVRFRFQIQEIRASLEKAFIWGSLLIGIYGLYQYFILGPWDALWMETSGANSFGSPEPLQVRVFSTMNSPQSLAGFLVARNPHCYAFAVEDQVAGDPHLRA